MLHIAMYPWFAIGHITSFLHLSNKLAEKGHRISFFLPTKTQPKFEPFNLNPSLITLIPTQIPHVKGLPFGTETTSDVPFTLHSLLMNAMDLTKPFMESSLIKLKPDFIFYDFTHWLPSLASNLGIKSVHYCTVSPATVGYLSSPERRLNAKNVNLMIPPPNFPPSPIKLCAHEAKSLAAALTKEYGGGISFVEREFISLTESDAICFKTCREMEGAYCDYIETIFGRPVILAGPVVPIAPSVPLEPEINRFLNMFESKTVIFCALGSECVLQKGQFQELVLGLEMTGLPFFAALKAPAGTNNIDSALPENFKERVKGKGYIYGSWVQQQLILNHPSVGCFVTHCGSGSLSEAMVSDCRLVLLPNVGDQIINAKLMGCDFKVGVEVEKGEEDGLFRSDGVCKAIKAAMDSEGEVGKEIKRNHERWREFLLREGIEDSYIKCFVEKLTDLLK